VILRKNPTIVKTINNYPELILYYRMNFCRKIKVEVVYNTGETYEYGPFKNLREAEFFMALQS
jgi:hypothetical protein